MKTQPFFITAESSAGLQQAVLALSEQVGEAIAAIAERDVDQLEQSLWRQQVLCTQLQKHFAMVTASHQDDTQNLDWGQAADALLQMTQVYAELVRQAGRTNDVLYELCVAYGSTGSHGVLRGHTHYLEA